MSKLLLGSIDLNKIDKSQIVDKDKDGKPFKNGAKYLNIAVWVNDKPDEYGNDAAIKMGTKENSFYIGNLKEYKKDSNQQQGNNSNEDEEDGLPF